MAGLVEALNPREGGERASTTEVPRRAAGPSGSARDRLGRAGAQAQCERGRRRVGEQLGINPDSLRNWVKQARIDSGQQPGVTTDERARIAELEGEVRELRRANSILKTASAFFAMELDRPQQR